MYLEPGEQAMNPDPGHWLCGDTVCRHPSVLSLRTSSSPGDQPDWRANFARDVFSARPGDLHCVGGGLRPSQTLREDEWLERLAQRGVVTPPGAPFVLPKSIRLRGKGKLASEMVLEDRR